MRKICETCDGMSSFAESADAPDISDDVSIGSVVVLFFILDSPSWAFRPKWNPTSVPPSAVVSFEYGRAQLVAGATRQHVFYYQTLLAGDSLAVSSMFNTKSAVDSLTVMGCWRAAAAAARLSLARCRIKLRAPLFLVGDVATSPVTATPSCPFHYVANN